MNKWEMLRQRIHELADRCPFDVCKSYAERCENTAYKEALTDVALVMNLIEAEYPEPSIPSAEACEAAEAILEREADKIERTRWSPDSWEYHARQASGARIVRDYLRSLHGPGKEGK